MLLTLLFIVVGGYLAAHLAFGWLAHRFHIVSGAEYLLLGVLLGPQVSSLIRASVVGEFAPLLTLALGWIGVVVGAQFHLPALIRIPAASYRIAFAEALLSFCAVTAGMVLVIVGVVGVPAAEAVVPAAALGAVATASAPTGIALVARKLGGRGPVVVHLQLSAAVDALVAITAFGLLLAIGHPPPVGAVRPPTATEWAVIGVGIGVVGGALFHLFLGGERKIDRLFIGLAGAVILASGAAAYLGLSPLLPTMLIGMILTNTSGSNAEIRRVLSAVERPLYFVLLIFAGAAWRLSLEPWLLAALLFLPLRALTKVTAGAGAAWLNEALPALGAGWGRALLGQGGLAVAIALNYLLFDAAPLAELVFTAALVSVLLTDLVSPRLVEDVVRSARRRRFALASPGAEALDAAGRE